VNPSEIRSQFLDFFRERGHTIVPSAPVVPHGDPTLLFTNAGMNQFKDVFLEQGSRPYTRVADSQKVIRVSGKHNDLEEVGPSPSHHTLFEMLGNWSFGDYYKREASQWAWELLTKVWKLDPKRLYVTVFKGDEQVGFDEEAYDIWHKEVGVAEDHISLHGKKDNFWEMGEVGPCGPCSELHYDFGSSFCREQKTPGHRCAVNGDCGRVVELWNLVFIQYRRDEKGRLLPLPRKHVDTGAGFERILKALEGVPSNYETSVFAPLIAYIAHLSGVKYQRNSSGNPHRVAADHIRMVSFALADGVLPSNEGRGYVVRRVLRRAARYGREIGLEAPFMHKLVEPLIAVMGDAYPELKERHDHIVGVIKAEEESFGRTLGRGLELFGGLAEKIKKEKSKVVSGDDAFKLYDTYGFPLDLTELLARERGFSVDTGKFNELMAGQKTKARGEKKFAASSGEFESGLKSQFVGYADWYRRVEAKLVGFQKLDGMVELVLDKTPFYVESGGQISDRGWLEIHGVKYEVTGVARRGEVIVHQLQAEIDHLKKGTVITAQVDTESRRQIQYNHTSTHLLHKALRKLVGMHCNQAGSLVAPDRLRFDFTHFSKLSPELIEDIEREVNKAIRADHEVRWYELPYKEAIDSGITALFGEKYGDVVRVVDIGGKKGSGSYSRELCGGCHVSQTGRIGLFRIVSEEAASAGVRRIEAVTGEYALAWTLEEHRQLEAIQDIVGSRGSSPVEKLQKTIAEKKALEKELEKLLGVWAASEAAELLESSTLVNDVRVVRKQYPAVDVERLKLVGDAIRSKDQKAVALLVSTGENGAGQLVCVVGDESIKAGKLKAGDLVGKAAKMAGGGGGGKPHMATAGTKSPELLAKAVEGFAGIVRGVV
jgi:alanyl-tRNA synthetase